MKVWNVFKVSGCRHAFRNSVQSFEMCFLLRRQKRSPKSPLPIFTGVQLIYKVCLDHSWNANVWQLAWVATLGRWAARAASREGLGPESRAAAGSCVVRYLTMASASVKIQPVTLKSTPSYPRLAQGAPGWHSLGSGWQLWLAQVHTTSRFLLRITQCKPIASPGILSRNFGLIRWKSLLVVHRVCQPRQPLFAASFKCYKFHFSVKKIY